MCLRAQHKWPRPKHGWGVARGRRPAGPLWCQVFMGTTDSLPPPTQTHHLLSPTALLPRIYLLLILRIFVCCFPAMKNICRATYRAKETSRCFLSPKHSQAKMKSPYGSKRIWDGWHTVSLFPSRQTHTSKVPLGPFAGVTWLRAASLPPMSSRIRVTSRCCLRAFLQSTLKLRRCVRPSRRQTEKLALEHSVMAGLLPISGSA